MGLGPQGGACELGGSSCTPFFPRGAGLRLAWGWGLLHFATGTGRVLSPPPLPSQLGLYFLGREGTRAVNGGRPSVAETMQAHASVICLQRPSLPTA